MTLLVGFCGPEGAGKSTAAHIVSELTGGTILPFAAPLKAMIAALGVPHGCIYGTQAEKEMPLAMLGGKTARHAMQTLGTEWGRQCMGADFWRDAWLAKADTMGDVVIADDVRFPNEAEAILSRGGCVFKLLGSPNDMQRVARHASEAFAALPCTAVIPNYGKYRAELRATLSGLLYEHNRPVLHAAE